jgi:hypothetical protein
MVFASSHRKVRKVFIVGTTCGSQFQWLEGTHACYFINEHIFGRESTDKATATRHSIIRRRLFVYVNYLTGVASLGARNNDLAKSTSWYFSLMRMKSRRY